jgi:Flp pilus assembly protein TadG
MTARRVQRERGAAAVEFALVLMLLVTIVFGITEFGRALYQYDTLTKAARAAARFVSVHDAEESPAVIDRAICVALAGSPWLAADGTGCDGPVVAPGLTPENIRVEDPQSTAALRSVPVAGDTGGTLDMVRVTISGYRFRTLVPFIVPDITFGDIVAYMPRSSL